MEKKIAEAYAVCFATGAGKEVLEDLQAVWKSPPQSFDQAALAHLEGQRHMLRYIESKIKQGQKKEEK